MKKLIIFLIFLLGCTTSLNEEYSFVDVEQDDIVTLKAKYNTNPNLKYFDYVYTTTLEKEGKKIEVANPIFRGKQGTTFTVNFVNEIDQPTTIHWHGLRHDNKDDGVPEVTQEEVKSGEKYTYTVSFPDKGIFWYHPHVREDLQQDKGLASSILVTSDVSLPVNHERVFVLDDILIEDGSIVPYGEEYANFALMGRFGNTFLINGKENFNFEEHSKEVVRYYIINVANVRPFKISFGDAKMKLVGSDLSLYEEETFVDSILITPAERYIVDVYFEEEGIYPIKHETPEKTYILGTITVEGEKPGGDYVDDFKVLKENNDIIEDIDQFREYFNKEVDYEIDLTIKLKGMMVEMMKNMEMEKMEDSMHKIEWEDEMPMMNPQSTTENVEWILKDVKSEKENMDFVMNAKIGDKIKIRLFNDPDSMHPMQHPIHLHGQRFLVLEQDGEKKENLVWKDTVLVPKGSTVDILVDVTNPGEWMFHCHIAEHLEAGMMTSLNVEEF